MIKQNCGCLGGNKKGDVLPTELRDLSSAITSVFHAAIDTVMRLIIKNIR